MAHRYQLLGPLCETFWYNQKFFQNRNSQIKEKMEDFSEIAFECILQPSVLDTKVLKSTVNRKNAVGILQELLTQLSSVTKTQIAVNNEGKMLSTILL